MPDPRTSATAGGGRAGDLCLFRVTTGDLDHTVAARDRDEAVLLLMAELGWERSCFEGAEIEALHPDTLVRFPISALLAPAVRHWFPAGTDFYAQAGCSEFLEACGGVGRVLMTPGWGE